MSLTEPQRAAFRYLQKRAADGEMFSGADLEEVAGWQPGSFSTYKTKHLKEYVKTVGPKRLTVDPRFMRVTEADFGEIVTQSRRTVARFTRAVIHSLLRYEFLLPLTNERRLRSALDELFFREPLEQRAREIGRASLEQLVPGNAQEADQDFFARVAEKVGGLLGGYSIGHVDGRFRVGSLNTYQAAAELLAGRGRYLVDETTAVVRFIMPIAQSRVETGKIFDVAARPSVDAPSLETAIETARGLFIAFFVESVIFDIHAEDEIWFLESGPEGERLYVLERDAGTTARVASAGRRSLNKSVVAPSGPPIVQWLRTSGYTSVADKIEKIEAGWRKNKVKTRRNWFEVLAGDNKGRERSVAGHVFPIIASIRARQGLDPVIHAERRAGEKPLPPK